MFLLILLWMIILGIALLVYLGFPLFSKTASRRVATSEDIIEERQQALFLERERSYAALADLDEDYETGKLSKADYQELRADLLQETAHVIMQLESSTMTEVEAEIERFKKQQRR